MKSAEDWAAIIDSEDDDEKDAFLEKYPTFTDMIRAVQSDAIKACAATIDKRFDEIRELPDDAPHRRPMLTEVAALAVGIYDLIPKD